MRKLTKRPYGLAKFKVGRTVYSKIVRFDKDTTEWMGGKYVFDKNSIVIEKSASKKVYSFKDFETWEEGIPVIYFDVMSAIPIRFSGDKTEGIPTAKAIQSTIKKEMATYEAEMMRKTRSKLMLGIMILVIISLVMIAFQFMTFQEIGKVAPKVIEAIPQCAQNIATTVTP